MKNSVVGPLTAAVVVVGLVACKKPAEEPAGEPAAAKPAAADTAAADKPKAPPAKTMDLAQIHLDCVAAFNAGDVDKLKACYADGATQTMAQSGMETKGADAIAEHAKMQRAAFSDFKWDVQLVMVNGKTVVSMGVGTGTHDGDLSVPGGQKMPASNNKTGGLAVTVNQYDDAGKLVSEKTYVDMGVWMKQVMGAKDARPPVQPWTDKAEIVVAADDDKERANVQVVEKLFAAFNSKKYDEMHALESKDIEVLDQSAPELLKGADARKAQVQGYVTAFPDLKVTGNTWAAGDYVFTEGVLAGTNTGPLPGMKKGTGKTVNLEVVEIRKLADGKITHQWLVINSMAMAMQLGLVPEPPAK